MNATILIVLVAVVALVAFVVAFVLIRRYIAFRRRLAETADMKKDLMAWKNLYGLVRGGNEGLEAKEMLSLKLGQIRDIFQSGYRFLRSTGRGGSRTPWFVLVGEPKSGKTSLLERSGLELRSGVSPELMKGAPLVPWVGAHSYTLDVAGRIFFDRWLKGSGAEWNVLVRSIRRRNRRFPLSGIILTIPADALLMDDPALTREKASIIGNELHHLLKGVGMNLPCHVVVTKLDMLLGFREYFSWLEGREAAAPFGWQNPTPGDRFDERALANWLDTLDGRLRESMMARLLDPKVLRDPTAVRRRIDTAGASSLFPDSLKSLRGNLSIYMNRIFGKEAWNRQDQLLLSGVFFTAAKDEGVTISREYAAFCGKPVAEASIVSEPQKTTDGRFIGGLLDDFVFACKVKASFTAYELFRRQIPGYLVAALVVVLGLIWLFVATFGFNDVRRDLEILTHYYERVSDHLRNGDYLASPLIVLKEGEGAVLAKNEVLRGDSHTSRFTALYQSQMAVAESVIAPFGFGVAGRFWFSFDSDLGIRQRQEIANHIRNRLVFRPAITTLFECFKDDVSAPFSQLKREAMVDFFRFMVHADLNGGENVHLHDIILYLFPDLTADMVNVLATYYDGVGCAQSDYLLERYDDPQLANEISKQMGTQFGDAWQKLEIYGETIYPKTRSVVRSGDEFRALMENAAGLIQGFKSGETNAETIAVQWRSDLERMSALREAIDRDAPIIQGESEDDAALTATLTAALEAKLDGKVPGRKAVDPLKAAIDDYLSRLHKDANECHWLVTQMGHLIKSRAGEAYVKDISDSIDRREKAVRTALDAETTELRDRMMRLIESKILENIPVGTDVEHPGMSVGGIRRYAVVGDIVKAALAAPLPENPKDIGEFFRTTDALASAEHLADMKLQEAQEVCTNDQVITSFAANVAELMRIRFRAVRERLLNRYAELHPRDGAGVGEMVAAQKSGKEVFDISEPLAAEAFGGITVAPMFDPGSAEICFSVYSEMLALASGKNPLPLPNKVGIELAMREYVDSYISYWANFGDRLRMSCADWASFRKMCAGLKPYEVNSLLMVVYHKSITILSEIPKACKNERQTKTVSDAIALLDSRIQMMTPHFSDVCIRQTTNWSLLSEDPTAAYRFLRECPATVLVSDYFAVDAAGAKGDVPWWTSFFESGLNILKRDARKQGVTELRRSNGSLLRFPFCADPVNPDPVRVEEIDGVWQLLTACGFAPVAAPTGADTAASSGGAPEAVGGAKAKAQDGYANRIVAKVHAPYRDDSDTPGVDKRAALDYFKWGERLYDIVDTLRDRENETIWTLSLTPLEKCQAFNDEKFPVLPIANYRYRYGELTVGGEVRGGRVALNSNADVQIARGTIDDADIALRLDAYSDPDDATSVKLRFDGPWAILRVYLMADGVYDAKTKACDVPIIVRDRYNLMSVLWVTLKINRALPKPSEWPTTSTWPNIPLK